MDPKSTPKKLFENANASASIDDDGKISIETSGGVGIAVDEDGNFDFKGLNAFGISDLVEVESIDTAVDGETTTFNIKLKSGGTATVVYQAGQFHSYSSSNAGMTILRGTSKALIQQNKPKA